MEEHAHTLAMKNQGIGTNGIRMMNEGSHLELNRNNYPGLSHSVHKGKELNNSNIFVGRISHVHFRNQEA
jgi:hypothetical protein